MRRALAVLVPLALALSLRGSLACDAAPIDEPTKSWSFVYEELPAALLSVWGSSANDIFFAGSDPKDGGGPWVLHWDGHAMTRLRTGQSGTLWWVSGTTASGDVYFSGEAGLALRYVRQTQQFTKLTGAEAGVTLFGIFPVPGARVWVVGSDTRNNLGKVYNVDGDALVPAADLPEGAGDGSPFFKVWGRSETDLWIVGLGQAALHRTAGGWVSFPTTAQGRLFTVHGNADTTVAVGGFITASAVALSDSGVSDITPSGAPQLNGVFVEPSGRVVAVGTGGAVWQRAPAGGAWSEVTVPSSLLDYHAVYVDPTGDVWAVGGFVLSDPLRQGMLLHFGAPIPTAVPE
ncbi:MAG: hypothetical protein U1F43_01025 [Myxococcota bacterium]